MRKKRIKDGITYVILRIVDVVMLLPVIWMSFARSKTNNGVFDSLSLPPRGWSPEIFIKGWKITETHIYARYLINTPVSVIPTTLLILVSCSVITYDFVGFDFFGSQFLFMVLIAALMLPNVIIIIPRCASFNKLGWLDSYMIFYAPAVMGRYPFFMFTMVQFLRGFSGNLDESTCTDGCSPFQCFIQTLLPLLEPALFSTGPFQFLWTWNDLFDASIYINTVSKLPLSLALRVSIDVTSSVEQNQVISMALASVTPLILLFFTARKCFVEGTATSGLKG